MNANSKFAVPMIALTLFASACAAETAESTAAGDDIAIATGDPSTIEESPEGESVMIENAGEMCVFDGQSDRWMSGDDQLFVDGERILFRVAVPGCLSHSCDVNRVARCNVTAKGNTLIVESVLSYEALEAEQCTMDCGQLWAFCESEPLAAGSYEIVHGSATRSLTVPSEVAACGSAPEECTDDDECANGYCHPTGEFCVSYD